MNVDKGLLFTFAYYAISLKFWPDNNLMAEIQILCWQSHRSKTILCTKIPIWGSWMHKHMLMLSKICLCTENLAYDFVIKLIKDLFNKQSAYVLVYALRT